MAGSWSCQSIWLPDSLPLNLRDLPACKRLVQLIKLCPMNNPGQNSLLPQSSELVRGCGIFPYGITAHTAMQIV